MRCDSPTKRLWIWFPETLRRTFRAFRPASGNRHILAPRPQLDSDDSLVTATAIGDPVVVIMRRRRALGVLLAAHATYDRHELIQLHDVRWVRQPRGFVAHLPGLRPKAMDRRLAEVDLTRAGNNYVAALPGVAVALTAPSDEPFHMANLSAGQYEDMLRLPPRQLRRMAMELCGADLQTPHRPRNRVSRVLRALKLAA